MAKKIQSLKSKKKSLKMKKRVNGEEFSPDAHARLVQVYNHVVDAILTLYDTKEQGGIKRKNCLDEPLIALYKAKGRIWGISKGRMRIKEKKYSAEEYSLFCNEE